MSGVEEKDRVVIEGKETTRRYAIWKRQPEDTKPVRGKGGGLRTDRNGWISGRFDEVFMLDADGALCVLTLFDTHHVVSNLTKRVSQLPIDHVCEAKWRLSKALVPDGDYTRSEPHFELLDGGPDAAEFAQAKRLTSMIARISYANPDIPLRLVVGGPVIGEAPPPPPPPSGIDEYGAKDPDELPSFLR
jgi:hypothetical protein